MNEAIKKLAKDASKIKELQGTLVLEILQSLTVKKTKKETKKEIPQNEHIIGELNEYESALYSLFKKYAKLHNISAKKMPQTKEELLKIKKARSICDVINAMLYAEVLKRMESRIKKRIKKIKALYIHEDGTVTFSLKPTPEDIIFGKRV